MSKKIAHPPPEALKMEAGYARDPQSPTPFAAAQEEFGQVVAWLRGPETVGQSHAEVERQLHRKGLELLRLLLEDHYRLRGLAEPTEAVVGADEQERGHRRGQMEREVETVFGTVRAERAGFSGRGLESLFPTDAALNLPGERYSHEVRRQVAMEVAQKSYDGTLATLMRTTAAHVPKRQAEALARKASQDFELYYEQTAVTGEASGELLVLTFDGKGVVMRPEHLREATRKQAKNKQNKLKSRRSKGEPSGRKRMALVAAVYSVDPFHRSPEQIINGLCGVRDLASSSPKRPRPQDKRVWASLVDSPEEVIEGAFREAHSRDPEHRKRWLVLVDGEEKLERLARKVARAQGAEVTVVVDFIHALEYLWKAGHALFDEGSKELEPWVLERLRRLLSGQVSQVAAGMRRSATKRKLTGSQREPIDRAANYLHKRKDLMRYGEMLAVGAPIASGVIEGTCRHLINDRLDITGARWSLEGAEAILKLRALLASGDFDDYWTFHERAEYRRNHTAHYRRGRPPPVQTPKKVKHLRVVQ